MSRPSKNSQVDFKFLIYRQEAIGISVPVIVEISFIWNEDTPQTEEDLIRVIQQGVTRWIKETHEGREVFECAGSDLNLGDLMSSYGAEEVAPYIPGCVSFKAKYVGIAEEMTYHTPLVDPMLSDDDLPDIAASEADLRNELRIVLEIVRSVGGDSLTASQAQELDRAQSVLERRRP